MGNNCFKLLCAYKAALITTKFPEVWLAVLLYKAYKDSINIHLDHRSLYKPILETISFVVKTIKIPTLNIC